MIIVHKIDDLAFDFFPELKADDNFESLRQKLVEYYSFMISAVRMRLPILRVRNGRLSPDLMTAT